MNITRLGLLSQLVSEASKRKPKIMIDPQEELRFISSKPNKNLDINIKIDDDDWTIPDYLKNYVTELKSNNEYSLEMKILKIYQKLCEDYIYDDNVLSYIKKVDEDTFALPNFYGRKPNLEWKENRATHNKRNCFEISRILAKILKELKPSPSAYDVYIIWDEALTHYFVGMVSDEYCITLDLDNFNSIKDLTRLKTGLTIDGINVLQDSSNNMFSNALNKFNEGRNKIAQDNIAKKTQPNQSNENVMGSEDLLFLRYTIEILKKEYNLDSQGIFEYMKEIIDTRIGPTARKKVWKRVDAGQYTRCLVVDIDGQKYVIDGTEKEVKNILRPIDEKDLFNEASPFFPYNVISRDWEKDIYDGR